MDIHSIFGNCCDNTLVWVCACSGQLAGGRCCLLVRMEAWRYSFGRNWNPCSCLTLEKCPDSALMRKHIDSWQSRVWCKYMFKHWIPLTNRWRIVGRPCGQFHGASIWPIWRTICQNQELIMIKHYRHLAPIVLCEHCEMKMGPCYETHFRHFWEG